MRYQDEYDDTTLKGYCQGLNHRAKALGVPGIITPNHLLNCILESAGVCQWCGESVVGAEFEIDHVISLGRGGPNTAENIALACPNCNRRKGEKHPAQFAAEIVAQSGYKTPLINRLLSRYDDEGLVQRQMFASDDDDSVCDDTVTDSDSAVVPPYTW